MPLLAVTHAARHQARQGKTFAFISSAGRSGKARCGLGIKGGGRLVLVDRPFTNMLVNRHYIHQESVGGTSIGTGQRWTAIVIRSEAEVGRIGVLCSDGRSVALTICICSMHWQLKVQITFAKYNAKFIRPNPSHFAFCVSPYVCGQGVLYDAREL